MGVFWQRRSNGRIGWLAQRSAEQERLRAELIAKRLSRPCLAEKGSLANLAGPDFGMKWSFAFSQGELHRRIALFHAGLALI